MRFVALVAAAAARGSPVRREDGVELMVSPPRARGRAGTQQRLHASPPLTAGPKSWDEVKVQKPRTSSSSAAEELVPGPERLPVLSAENLTALLDRHWDEADGPVQIGDVFDAGGRTTVAVHDVATLRGIVPADEGFLEAGGRDDDQPELLRWHSEDSSTSRSRRAPPKPRMQGLELTEYIATGGEAEVWRGSYGDQEGIIRFPLGLCDEQGLRVAARDKPGLQLCTVQEAELGALDLHQLRQTCALAKAAKDRTSRVAACVRPVSARPWELVFEVWEDAGVQNLAEALFLGDLPLSAKRRLLDGVHAAVQALAAPAEGKPCCCTPAGACTQRPVWKISGGASVFNCPVKGYKEAPRKDCGPIVHHDIKFENIVVSGGRSMAPSGLLEAKIVDFGSATRCDRDEAGGFSDEWVPFWSTGDPRAFAKDACWSYDTYAVGLMRLVTELLADTPASALVCPLEDLPERLRLACDCASESCLSAVPLMVQDEPQVARRALLAVYELGSRLNLELGASLTLREDFTLQVGNLLRKDDLPPEVQRLHLVVPESADLQAPQRLLGECPAPVLDPSSPQEVTAQTLRGYLECRLRVAETALQQALQDTKHKDLFVPERLRTLQDACAALVVASADTATQVKDQLTRRIAEQQVRERAAEQARLRTEQWHRDLPEARELNRMLRFARLEGWDMLSLKVGWFDFASSMHFRQDADPHVARCARLESAALVVSLGEHDGAGGNWPVVIANNPSMRTMPDRLFSRVLKAVGPVGARRCFPTAPGGEPPLALAARRNRLAPVHELLAQGALPTGLHDDRFGQRGPSCARPASALAAAVKHPDMFRLLVGYFRPGEHDRAERLASIEGPDGTLVMLAAPYAESVFTLLDHIGGSAPGHEGEAVASPSTTTRKREERLRLAVRCADGTPFAAASGVPSLPSPSPLFLATDPGVLAMLVELGADASCVAPSGRTALQERLLLARRIEARVGFAPTVGERSLPVPATPGRDFAAETRILGAAGGFPFANYHRPLFGNPPQVDATKYHTRLTASGFLPGGFTTNKGQLTASVGRQLVAVHSGFVSQLDPTADRKVKNAMSERARALATPGLALPPPAGHASYPLVVRTLAPVPLPFGPSLCRTCWVPLCDGGACEAFGLAQGPAAWPRSLKAALAGVGQACPAAPQAHDLLVWEDELGFHALWKRGAFHYGDVVAFFSVPGEFPSASAGHAGLGPWQCAVYTAGTRTQAKRTMGMHCWERRCRYGEPFDPPQDGSPVSGVATPPWG